MPIQTLSSTEAHPHAARTRGSYTRAGKRASMLSKALTAATAVVVLLCLVSPDQLRAQTGTQSAEMRALQEELAIITDLGLLFGFILRMEENEPALALSTTQIKRLREITDEIAHSQRLEPVRAHEIIDEIEEQILEVDQLLYTDQLFINREETRVPGSGATAGAGRSPGESEDGQSSGSAASFASGGPYNPLLDTSRRLGQTFEQLRDHLSD